jgi:hypothetical protein
MNARPLTDAQISQALRGHLPEAAAPGLRQRVMDATETTAQLRSFPSFLGALSDADPVARRRSLVIAAALLLAAALASAAAAGAWRLFQRDPVDALSLEPPADLPAFVLSSYERLPQLPPLALTWQDGDSTKGRIYVDRSGAVRFDRFESADATDPASYRILSPDHRISGMAPVDGEAVWIEPGHEAIGEDPRLFLRTVLHADEGPGCEMERGSSEVGNGAAAAGWLYVGVEYVAGRPTHHVSCVGDLWIDIETRLILRSEGPAADDAGRPIPVESTEVTEIAFGEQPAALFQPPEGLARISMEEYNGYICARALPNEIAPGISDCPTAEAEATPPPAPVPTPMPTVRPNTSECDAVPPGDPREPAGPMAWTRESLNEDWPAPVRPEPAGGGSVQPMPLTYVDPTGDTGSAALPCIDIRDVTVGTHEVFFNLASNQPPDVEPSEAWIAYGVVVDDDRDGVPDRRFGIENPLRTVDDPSSNHRVWRTDLDTGRTESAVDGDFSKYFFSGFTGGYPGNGDREGFSTGRHGARFRFGREFDTTGGMETRGFKLDMPFYTWASVIVNGRVVATDYAPDTGWLLATPGSRPGGTFLLGDPFPHLSMTVPDGWASDARGVCRGTCEGDVTALVRFDVIDNPKDVCFGAIKPAIRPSFDDLVAYVAGLPSIEISESADVTVDGFRGKQLQYRSVGSDVDCAFAGVSITAFDNVWILDVDGVHLLIASGSLGSTTGGAVMADIRQMVDSIRFER